MDEDFINDDFTDDDWLLLLEDEGLSGLGRVIGYAVYSTEEAAQRNSSRRAFADALELFINQDLPNDVETEVMTYRDFQESYGDRMPLCNRLRIPSK